MHVIDRVEPILEFKFQTPVGKFLRDFFQELEHTFEESICFDPFKRAVLIFADSLIYGTLPDPFMSSAVLIENYPNEIAKYPKFGEFVREIHLLSLEQNKFLAVEHNLKLFKAFASVDYKSYCDANLKKIGKIIGISGLENIFVAHKSGDQSRAKENMLKNFMFFHGRSSYAPLELGKDIPFYPLTYISTEKVSQARDALKNHFQSKVPSIPVLFLEPYAVLNGDWLDKLLMGKPAVLFFRSPRVLWHCMAFPAVASLVFSEKVLSIVGDLYLEPDMIEKLGIFSDATFTPFVFADHPSYEKRVIPFCDALHELKNEYLSGGREPGTVAHRVVKHIGTNLKREIEAKTYGRPFGIEVERMWGNDDWYTKYKEAVPSQYNTYPVEVTPSTGYYDLPYLRKMKRRELVKRDRVRIAHIVPQIVDGGHAPSKLMRTLVNNADRDQWEVSVICHEANVMRRKLYPRDDMCSKSTPERAPETLAQWNENKIPYYISEARGDYLETAYEICEYLSQNDIDIIACHGNDRINLLIPILSDVPKRVFVEHSGFPVMKEFDLVLTSLNGNAEKMRSVFDNLGTVIEDLPYGVDARADWLPEPPDFGISPQVKLLTTISNHLESRVSGKFVEAIGKILQRVPNAAYMPIGPVSNIEGFEKRFESYGVQDRVICLKNQKIPSQICRGMHLYLNEFPFGSGISMLDAMASGIPVVTMYDENGVMQAKNGGNYIGIDHAITSLNPDEYVELAVRLLTDVKLYAEWHQHALDRYELFGPQKYISNFEKIVYNTLIEKQ